MNLELTLEHLALRDSVRGYLESAPAPTGSSTATTAYWRGITGLGVTGLLIPESSGGGGATMTEAGIVLAELGRVLDPGPWMSTSVVVPRALARLEFGDRAAGLLGEIAAGTTIAALDVCGLRAPAAEAVRRGGEVVLNGTLAAVPDVSAAQVLLVPARDHGAVALFAVESASAGADFAVITGVDRSRERCRVTLRDAPARCLGQVGADTAGAIVDDVLIAAAADAVGAAGALLDLTVEYAKTRTQFGRPIGAFQAVAHLCVDMYETVELARGGVLRGLWAADSADDRERHSAAVELKAFSGRLATVGEIAVQVFGGIGFTWEHPAHRYFERLLSWSAYLGSPERYLREVGARFARDHATASRVTYG
ncbi:acyl-CoA dehydrogenase [Nocardia nova SH22a]|uniref:Acyl-CoA dehydrogenase n=1 Tax=Nocardia nova SH22a TaxID=1415166 RepID=W5TKK6_9NOCA|nr:acyl-CoA dehydrogenase family protein [Nocardia nova]AHH17771.1 acyl-CoA dehydrogenase [Nocardia nova SH22a]